MAAPRSPTSPATRRSRGAPSTSTSTARDECFVAAFDTVTGQLRERVEEAYKAEGEWADGIRAAIGAMLAFLAAEPNLARLAMVEALVAGPVVVERYDAAVQTFLPYLEAGRKGRSKAVLDRLSDSTEEALVGGMVSLIARRIVAARPTSSSRCSPIWSSHPRPLRRNDEAAQIARALGAGSELPRARSGGGGRVAVRRPRSAK